MALAVMRKLSSLVPLLVAVTACRSAPDAGSLPAPSPTRSAQTASLETEIRDPLQPELVAFQSGANTLHGFLYRPSGAAPFPAIIFNHGSEELPGDKRGQARFFVKHGFVLFVPHRRGHGRSKDAGEHISAKWANSGRDPNVFVEELSRQADDVTAAISYVAALPFVDRTRIAVSGCSLGGIESLFAAERESGIVAAIDFAGAAMTWAENVPLQQRMRRAARDAKVPVFFVQAENDFNTAPSRVLSEEMRLAGKPTRVHIFPPTGTTHEDGHGFCTGGDSPPWGDEVLQFLREAMAR
jgi:dienelactone hydrolase